MTWTRVTVALPKAGALVLGAILEGDNRRAVRPVRLVSGERQYDRTSTAVKLYGHQVTHWMPLPKPPVSDE